jgi:immune inhibitor A
MATLKSSFRNHSCGVAPSPEAYERIKNLLNEVRGNVRGYSALRTMLSFRFPVRLGMNDGVVRPAHLLRGPQGAPSFSSTPFERAPLRGSVNVAVVLVSFPDKPLVVDAQHFQDLFFSTGTIPTGSVKEYYAEVTKGLVNITGSIVGPITLPNPITFYANGQSGMGSAQPNAQTMALDTITAADPLLDFTPFDNDGDGFVDAFVIVHAGQGAEVTLNAQDIWSHKWVLPNGPFDADAVKVLGYLTVPEDCKLGVCAHELGHLLFGFPDLYDTDNSSAGIGNWCLMAGGSWNGGGDTPAHPSAWCKIAQGWASSTIPSAPTAMTINDVKDDGPIMILRPTAANPSEYFLLENRQRNRFDSQLPGDGLLVWHIDDSRPDNTDETHYKVALLQADGKVDLEKNTNRGDDGDPYPGSSGVAEISASTTPSTLLYSGADSQIRISNISSSAPTMQFDLDITAQPVAARVLKRGTAL